VNTGDVIGTAISLLFLLLSLSCLIYFNPSSRLETAGLAALFFISFLGVLLYAVPLVAVLWPDLRRWKRAKLIAPGLGAAVLATGLVLALLQVLPDGSKPTSNSTATASPPPNTLSPMPIGAKECSFLPSSPVGVQKVFSADGQPGISSDLRVLVVVNTAPTKGHTYWLFSKGTNGNGRFVFVAKAQVPGSLGQHQLPVVLPSSPVGSVRDIFVADGGPDALTWLQENNANNGKPQWDENRLELQHGVVAVSNVCEIKKDRM
jgi:hypothetical protein